MDTVKSRLDQVVSAAGLSRQRPMASNTNQASVALAVSESTLAKQTAAAEAATNKAEAALVRLDNAK